MTGEEKTISFEYGRPAASTSAVTVRGRWESGRWVEIVSTDARGWPETASLDSGPELAESPPVSGGGWRRDLPFRWEFGVYIALFVVALGMRIYDLGGRAVHHDESLHGYFSWLLFNGSGYSHDPLMHGPFLFHITAGSFFPVRR